MPDMKLDERMKLYESRTEVEVLPYLPLMIRLDGKGFSKYTKGLQKPFDSRMHFLMRRLTRTLMRECGARAGYTQSDEITLVIYSDDYKSEMYFKGRVQKIVSNLAGLASAWFSLNIGSYVEERKGSLAVFDCRAFVVPNKEEAVNNLIWRESDARRNALSGLARAHFSQKEVHGKNADQKIQMLKTKGVLWEDQPNDFKYGTFILKGENGELYETVSTDDVRLKDSPNREALIFG